VVEENVGGLDVTVGHTVGVKVRDAWGHVSGIK
jgi:hypothetical protein